MRSNSLIEFTILTAANKPITTRHYTRAETISPDNWQSMEVILMARIPILLP